MATKLQDLRAKYPQYSDMSDQEFATAFHGKFYSDMSFDDFSQEIGLTAQPAPTGTRMVEQFDDGGRIVENTETGVQTYMGDGYATSDPMQIAKIKSAGGDAAAVYERGFAEDIISQVGEIPARAASAIKGVPFVGSYIDELIEQFSPQAAQATRAAQEAREIVAPTTTALSRAGTGIAAAIPAIAAAPVALPASLTARVGLGAGLGGVGGGLEGLIYGYGEGATPEERRASALEAGKTGAAVGAGLGAGLPVVGAGIGALRARGIRRPAQQAVEQIGVKEDAARIISEAMQMDQPVAAENLARAGQYASLGQAGPATRNLLDLAAASTSEGAAIARQNIEEVAGQAGVQFKSLMDDTLGGPQAAQRIQDELMQSTSPQRAQAYDAAYDAEIDYSAPAATKLQELLKRLDTSDLRNAEKLMRREGQPSRQIMAKLDDAGNVVEYETLPDVRQIDYITRALNNVSPTAPTEDKTTARALASQIRKTLDQLVPKYAVARDVAGDVISLRNALEFGEKLLAKKTTRYDVEKALDGMTGAEIAATKQGIRSYVDEIMANTAAAIGDPNQDARELIKPLKEILTGAGKQKMQLLLGDDADEFLRQLDEVYSAMSMRASTAQQSKTAVRQMAKETVEDMMTPTMLQEMTERGPVTGAMETLRRTLSAAPSRPEQFRRVMGEVAEPLTRQADLTRLLQQTEQLRILNPEIERAADMYRRMLRGGTQAAAAATPALTGLLTGR